MIIKVGPAKRVGGKTTIFNASLDAAQVLAHSDGSVNVTFNANGIYSSNSTYQYNMRFSKEDLETVLRISGGSGENGEP
jgi:hypothetical protein